jgi:hypothetical protein
MNESPCGHRRADRVTRFPGLATPLLAAGIVLMGILDAGHLIVSALAQLTDAQFDASVALGRALSEPSAPRGNERRAERP